jgi:hypothetical protein
VPSGPDPAGGQQHVQAAARPEVQDGLARPQVRDGDRVPAAQAGPQRRLGYPGRVMAGPGAEAPGGERVRVATGDRASVEPGARFADNCPAERLVPA